MKNKKILDRIIGDIFIKYDQKNLNQIGLLSVKPKIYVCNVDEKNIVKMSDIFLIGKLSFKLN